jgi:hypothetical protein
LQGDCLKIIIRDEEPIRLYHHPREVSVLAKSKLVRTFNEDGSLLEEFSLVDKEVGFSEDFDNNQSEIIVTLHVRK